MSSIRQHRLSAPYPIDASYSSPILKCFRFSLLRVVLPMAILLGIPWHEEKCIPWNRNAKVEESAGLHATGTGMSKNVPISVPSPNLLPNSLTSMNMNMISSQLSLMVVLASCSAWGQSTSVGSCWTYTSILILDFYVSSGVIHDFCLLNWIMELSNSTRVLTCSSYRTW